MVRSGRERGQLILIGALLVAATILASITLLNAVHESPKINTQQDSQSLVEAERTVDQTKANLEGSFLANTSVDEVGEKLPYANESFNGLVEEYNNQSTNISTTEAAGIVNVMFNDAESARGAVAWQNESISGFEKLPGSGGTTILAGADRLPRLSMLVNSTDTSTTDSFKIEVDTETLRIYGDRVTRNGNPICDRDSAENAVELDFVNGTGAVITDAEYCGDIDLAPASSSLTVVFDNQNNADGTFVVSGENAAIGAFSPDDNRGTRVDAGPGPGTIFVDPAFEIEYDTPNVAYNATFSLYNTTG
jgi:hypothetical protein